MKISGQAAADPGHLAWSGSVAAGVPKATAGRDAAKKVPGRKRGLAVDVLGLVIQAVVAAASIHDTAIGNALLDRVAAATAPGSVQIALVDQGFKNSVIAHGATHVSTPDPGAWLLDRIDAREKALTSHLEQTQTRIEELTARLRDLDQDLDHLRITRKTLLVLAGEPDPAPPPPPAPTLPDHPAYQQILTLMADTGQPARACDLCLALDLPLARKNIENTRAKLKRLVSLGILAEIEPGLFAQPHP
ncbi:transposase [Nonomuraea sp. NPDC049784]|uniref:transposase n=1 Tax=Nonomuraea sp. NPDC049784 TaxID=3154361 RepID=UPI0033DD9AE1